MASSRLALSTLVLLACGESSAPEPEEPPRVEVEEPPEPAPVAIDAPCRAATPDERAAIEAAETFVRVEGYTDAPVAADHELTHESLELATREERIAARHDTLAPIAFGVFPHEGADVTVVFQYTASAVARGRTPVEIDVERRVHGRAVEVEGGIAQRVVHMDALLSHAERVCPE